METDQDLAFQLEELNEHVCKKKRKDETTSCARRKMRAYKPSWIICKNFWFFIPPQQPRVRTMDWRLSSWKYLRGTIIKKEMSKEIDPQFYVVQERDHQIIMWSKHVPERPVAARTSIWQLTEPVNLLTYVEEVAIAEDAPILHAARAAATFTTAASVAPPPPTVDEEDFISFNWLMVTIRRECFILNQQMEKKQQNSLNITSLERATACSHTSGGGAAAGSYPAKQLLPWMHAWVWDEPMGPSLSIHFESV